MKLEFKTPLKRSFQDIQSGFDINLFTILSKGLMPFAIKRFDGCKKNDEIHINIGIPPIHFRWVSLVTFDETNASGWSFIDEGKVLPWPLIYWQHHHRVDRISEHESIIVDSIQYECSPKFLGRLIWPVMWIVFSVRPDRYRQYFKE